MTGGKRKLLTYLSLWTEAFTRLIKVGDDLVEEPQTLHPHVVPIQLDVEVIEVGYGGEQHSDLSVGLIVQVLQGRQISSDNRDKIITFTLLLH